MYQLMNTIDGTYKRCCAENIGISKHFIRQLALSETIPTVKAGTVTLINYNVLMQYLQTGTVAEAPIAEVTSGGIVPIPEVIGK